MADTTNQLASLQERQQGDLGSLEQSPTAASGESAPTPRDIGAQQRLLKLSDQIATIKNNQLRDRWYGPQNQTQADTPTVEGGQSQGVFSSVLDALARPLYGVVGAVDYATGKSPESSIFGAMAHNMKDSKRTFGNVLKDTGVPGVISAPVGFMMDVAFDPINWMTAGSTALIPRVAEGLYQGTVRGGIASGLKAAARGAESRVLESALTVKNIGKIFSRAAPEAAVESTGRMGGLIRNLEQRSAQATQEFAQLTGRDVVADIAKSGTFPIPGGGEVSQYRMTLGDMVRSAGNNIPFVNKYFKYFDYNNAEWTRLARMKDILLKVSGGEDQMKTGIKAYIRSVEQGMPFDQALQIARQESGVMQSSLGKISQETPYLSDINFNAADEITGGMGLKSPPTTASGVRSSQIVRDMGDTMDIVKDPGKFVSADHVENARRLIDEQLAGGGFRGIVSDKQFVNDLKDIIGRGNLGDTGWQWFDDMKRKSMNLKYEVKLGKRSVDIGEGVGTGLKMYEEFISFFKRAAVGGSPSAWTNAIVGNPTMAWMGGVNILDPAYLSRVKDAWGITRGAKNSDLLLGEMFRSSDMMKTMGGNPSLFKRVTGMSPDFLRTRYAVEHAMSIGQDAGLLGSDADPAEISRALGYAMDEVKQVMGVAGQANPRTANAIDMIAAAAEKPRTPRGSDYIRALMEQGKPITEADLPPGIAHEFFDSTMANKAFKYISEKAKQGNPAFKLLDLAFNRASQAYEGIDQTYKLGTVMYAAMDGFTERELRIIARNIRLAPQDLTKTVAQGITRYKMSGAKALELANEVYMNYGAMPAAVKVLRNLPLLGSPFASFAYAMALKTGGALAYNPAVFNKVQFAMKDFGGTASPLEKSVLSGPQYAYLNEPGMFRLPGVAGSPFLDKYGMYLNATNMIPYLSMNMFTPPERRYTDLYSNRIVGLIDSSPFLKDPIGAVMFDNFIQPMIIRDSRPLGMFGQPLYPVDASLTEKVARGAQSALVDPLVPGILGIPAGLVQGAAFPGATDYMPSYRWRKLANALQGQSEIGIQGKEPAGSRTARAIGSAFGVPVQAPVSLTNLPKNAK